MVLCCICHVCCLLLVQPKLRSTALKALQKALQLWPEEVRPLIEGAEDDFKGEAVNCCDTINNTLFELIF